jgi:HEPN domain-containing protein
VKYEKWIDQAHRDLHAAQRLLESGFHEWCCFLALQAAEKALKSYFLALGMEPPFARGRDGHDIVKLSSAWPESVRMTRPDLAEAQMRLNLFSENTRYPHLTPGSPERYVAPHEDHLENDGVQAVADAKTVVDACERLDEEGHRFAARLGQVLQA